MSTTRARGRRPRASARSAVARSDGRGPVGDLRGGAGGVDAVLAGHRLELGQALQAGVAQALVALHPVGGAGGLALLVDVGGVDRQDLGVEAALGPGPSGQLLGPEAEGVAVVAGDAPPLGDALGPLELRGELVLAEVGLGDGHAQAQLLGRVGPDGDAAHELDPAGHGHVGHARADQAGGQVGGLLRRPALGVDGGGCGLDGQPGGQPGGAGEVEGLLAHLADAAADHLLHGARVDPGPLDHGGLHRAQQVDGVDGGQGAVASPHGGAHGLGDHDLGHGGDPTARTGRRAPWARRRRRGSGRGGVVAVLAVVGQAGLGLGQGGPGLGQAAAAALDGGVVEAPVVVGRRGDEVELSCHDPSMRRGCDSDVAPGQRR